jgi:hypothetical protein
MPGSALKPAAERARGSSVRFPNESAEYRRARAQSLAGRSNCRRVESANDPRCAIRGKLDLVFPPCLQTLPACVATDMGCSGAGNGFRNEVVQ